MTSAGRSPRVPSAGRPVPRVTDGLARSGRLSYSCVRALTRVAEADTESDLLAVGLAGTVAHVERIVRGWRWADENAQPDPDSERFGVRLHWDDDGSLRLAGRLSAEDGALLLVALEAAQERLDRDRPAAGSADAGAGAPEEDPGDLPSVRTPSTQTEAVLELARTFLDPDPDQQSAAARHQVVVHVDADVLAADTAAGAAHLKDGPALTAEAVARIACDASLVVMLQRGQEVLDVGRSRVQGHHIRYWSRGGRTALANLVLLCGYHHRLIHRKQFSVRVDEQQQLVFRDPHGRRLSEGCSGLLPAWMVPPLLPPAEDDLLPLWTGEKLDLDYTVSVLLDWRSDRTRRSGRAAEGAEPAAA